MGDREKEVLARRERGGGWVKFGRVERNNNQQQEEEAASELLDEPAGVWLCFGAGLSLSLGGPQDKELRSSQGQGLKWWLERPEERTRFS
jgi:hypothetical protein